MTARPIPVPLAAGHLRKWDGAPAALAINPEARDCDLAASAAAIVGGVQVTLENIAARGDEDFKLAESLAAPLELACEILAALITRTEPRAEA